jgi:hypothetical protein
MPPLLPLPSQLPTSLPLLSQDKLQLPMLPLLPSLENEQFEVMPQHEKKCKRRFGSCRFLNDFISHYLRISKHLTIFIIFFAF